MLGRGKEWDSMRFSKECDLSFGKRHVAAGRLWRSRDDAKNRRVFQEFFENDDGVMLE